MTNPQAFIRCTDSVSRTLDKQNVSLTSRNDISTSKAKPFIKSEADAPRSSLLFHTVSLYGSDVATVAEVMVAAGLTAWVRRRIQVHEMLTGADKAPTFRNADVSVYEWTVVILEPPSLVCDK
eukprot:scaffold365212_cov37-Prasinocladus_malaysianus.AAC.1